VLKKGNNMDLNEQFFNENDGWSVGMTHRDPRDVPKRKSLDEKRMTTEESDEYWKYKKQTHLLIYRTHKVDHDLIEQKDLALKKIKEKYDQDLKYANGNMTDEKIAGIEENYGKKWEKINDEFDEKMHIQTDKMNSIIKLQVLRTKKNKRVKEYFIEKGLKFELIKNEKRRRCVVEGFKIFSPYSQEDDKLKVKIRYIKNNRIGSCNWLDLIPYGHGINK